MFADQIMDKDCGILNMALDDASKQFMKQHEDIKRSCEKLKLAEQRVGDMMQKTMSTSHLVGQFKTMVEESKTAILEQKSLCENLKSMIDKTKKDLRRTGEDSKWKAFHTTVVDKRVEENSRLVQTYTDQRNMLRERLRTVMGEMADVNDKLSDAAKSDEFMQKLKSSLRSEHQKELVNLRESIRDAYNTRMKLMSSRSEVSRSMLKQLLPNDEEYNLMITETDNLRSKCSFLRKRLHCQAKEMLYYDSKSSVLSLKIKKMMMKLHKMKEGEITTFNRKRTPLTWFEAPGSDIKRVKEFLARKQGPYVNARLVRYVREKERDLYRQRFQNIRYMFEAQSVNSKDIPTPEAIPAAQRDVNLTPSVPPVLIGSSKDTRKLAKQANLPSMRITLSKALSAPSMRATVHKAHCIHSDSGALVKALSAPSNSKAAPPMPLATKTVQSVPSASRTVSKTSSIPSASGTSSKTSSVPSVSETLSKDSSVSSANVAVSKTSSIPSATVPSACGMASLPSASGVASVPSASGSNSKLSDVPSARGDTKKKAEVRQPRSKSCSDSSEMAGAEGGVKDDASGKKKPKKKNNIFRRIRTAISRHR